MQNFTIHKHEHLGFKKFLKLLDTQSRIPNEELSIKNITQEPKRNTNYITKTP